jgi:hypothetical protein
MNNSQVKQIEKDKTRGTCKVHGQMRNEYIIVVREPEMKPVRD